MALIVADRVLETTTSTGTGAFIPAGPILGYRSFASVMVGGDTAGYSIQAVDTNGFPTGAWETGVATYTAGLLTRTTVTASSNGNALVPFAAGTKQIFLTLTTGNTLANLADVDVVTTAPAIGQFLAWSGVKWVPTTITGGGGTVTVASVVNRAPTAADDGSKGYLIGDYWLNQTNRQLYKAISNSIGAAAWTSLGVNSTPVLDTVSGAAAAYGVIKLRTAYTGFAFRVRRASDSTTLDIGFTAAGVADFAAADGFGASTTLSVCIWYDQSGNARDTSDAGASAPALVARTIGLTRAITWAINGLSFFTLPSSVSLNRNAFSAVSIVRPRGGYYSTFATLGTTQFILGINNIGQLGYYNGAQQIDPLVDHTGSGIYGVTDDGTNGIVYLNDLSATQGYPGSPVVMTGGAIPRTSGVFDGEMSAVILYPAAKSAANMASIREAIYSQVGIAPQIRDRVVFVGDSITHGYSATSGTSWAQSAIDQCSRPYVYVNAGVPSELASAELTAISSYTSLYRTSRKNVAFVFSGTNDIAAGGTASATVTTTNSICTAMKNAGFEVIVCSMLPRVAGMSGGQTSGGFETARLAYNVSLRSGYASFAAAIADFGNDATMGIVSSASDTTLYFDGIHPTALGHSYLAAIAQAALNARG